MKRATIALLILLLMPFGAAASTLGPGQVLVATFTTSPPFLDQSNNAVEPDYLGFMFATTPTYSPGGIAYTTRLYDGATLLGSYSGTGSSMAWPDQIGWFASGAAGAEVSSSYTSLHPTVVDFSRILAGTIDGRLEFELTAGALSWADDISGRALLFEVVSNSVSTSLWAWTDTASVRTVSAMPEPTSLILLGSGLLAIARRRTRRA